MGLFNFLSNKFTNDPKDFILKLEFYGSGEDYICFKYSGNRGKSWKTIMCCHEPFITGLDPKYDYEFRELIYRFHNNSFKHEKEKFSSVEKIEKYMEKEYQEYEEKKKKRRIDIARYQKEKAERLNSLNK